MEEFLRKIGERFEIRYDKPLMSTDLAGCMARIWTYEVVAHRKAQRYIGDEEGIMCEEIKPISVRYEALSGANNG